MSETKHTPGPLDVLRAELAAERMAHRATGQSADTLAKRNGELSRALRDCADTLGAILDGVSVPSDNDTHTVLQARAAIAKAGGKGDL